MASKSQRRKERRKLNAALKYYSIHLANLLENPASPEKLIKDARHARQRRDKQFSSTRTQF